MTADVIGVFQGRDGDGHITSFTMTKDQQNNLTAQHAFRTNGGPVETGNPLPTQDTNAGNTLQSIEVLLSNPLKTSPGVSGAGADRSAASPVIQTVLATFLVVNPGQYRIQNQSAAALQLVFDDNLGGTPSVMLLASSGQAGTQGADTTPEMSWFTGRIRVCGAAGSQFFGRSN